MIFEVMHQVLTHILQSDCMCVLELRSLPISITKPNNISLLLWSILTLPEYRVTGSLLPPNIKDDTYSQSFSIGF